jgi:hypothetical protein
MRAVQRQSPSQRRREREELLAEVGLVPRLRWQARTDRKGPITIQRTELEEVTVQRDWYRPDPVAVESSWSRPVGRAVIIFGAAYLIAQLVRAAIAGTLGG